jgi:hypothetical protein
MAMRRNSMRRIEFFFIMLGLLLAACEVSKPATATFTPTITPTAWWIPPSTVVLAEDCSQRPSSSYPEFINFIFPEPECSYTIQDNHLIVQVGLSGKEIDSCPSNEGDPFLLNRVELYIDNQYFPIRKGLSNMMGYIVEDEKGQRICMLDEGPWLIYWETTVTVGAHTGKLEITDNQGNVQEFIWNFEIWYETK